MKFLKYAGVYFWNILRWLDCGMNCIFLLGSYNETISTRAAKARANGRPWGCILCKLLDKVRHGHCSRAISAKVGDDAIIQDGE
jgi:hypothetical protein